MLIITIDPGIEGAICVQSGNRYTLYPMPLIKKGRSLTYDYLSLISILNKYKSKEPLCFVETQFRGSKAIDHCGIIKGIILALGYQLQTIHPSTWSSQLKKVDTKRHSLPNKKELTDLLKKTPNKYRSVLLATYLFPRVIINNQHWAAKHNLILKNKREYADGLADSLLLNYYVNNYILKGK